MKHIAFAIGALALGLTAAAPARADFAVIKFKDTGACRAWYDHAAKPWGTLSGFVGLDAVLGRRPVEGQLGDEASLVQGLVLLS